MSAKPTAPMIEIRRMARDDESFIFASWLNNFKTSPFGKRITHNVYFDKHHRLIERVLERPGVQVLVACNPKDVSQIFGYLVYEQPEAEAPVVHFAFVKAFCQKLGICKAMFTHAAIDFNQYVFTHWTPVMDELIKRHPGLLYDPYRSGGL